MGKFCDTCGKLYTEKLPIKTYEIALYEVGTSRYSMKIDFCRECVDVFEKALKRFINDCFWKEIEVSVVK